MGNIKIYQFQQLRVGFSVLQLIFLFVFLVLGFWKTVTVISICMLVLNLIIEVCLLLLPEYREFLKSKN